MLAAGPQSSRAHRHRTRSFPWRRGPAAQNRNAGKGDGGVPTKSVTHLPGL